MFSRHPRTYAIHHTHAIQQICFFYFTFFTVPYITKIAIQRRIQG